jgi:hypothetical protein
LAIDVLGQDIEGKFTGFKQVKWTSKDEEGRKKIKT